MRAKETFLTPNAPYALPIPSDLLASFNSTLDLDPHGRRPSSFSIQGPEPLLTVPGQPPLPPYPEIFEELEERVTGMLSDSLDRFVVATFHNVGMPRAYCGCAGGSVIGLTGRFVHFLRRSVCEQALRRAASPPSPGPLCAVLSPAIHSGFGQVHAFPGTLMLLLPGFWPALVRTPPGSGARGRQKSARRGL